MQSCFPRSRSSSTTRPDISWPVEQCHIQQTQEDYPPLPKYPPPPPPPPLPTASRLSAPLPPLPALAPANQPRRHQSHPARLSNFPAVSLPSHHRVSSTKASDQNHSNHSRNTSRTTQSSTSKLYAHTSPLPTPCTASRLSTTFDISNFSPDAEHFYSHNHQPDALTFLSSPSATSSCSDGTCFSPHSTQSRGSDTGRSDSRSDSVMDLPSHIPSSDTPPTGQDWDDAGEVVIYDSDGVGRKFKSLYEGESSIGEQQLIIFVRHFFCGACQAYLQSLSSALPLETYFTLPVPSSITIIGLGSPKLIPYYRSVTGTPFPMYTDPTRRLYKKLGMGWSLSFGKRVDYMGYANEWDWLSTQVKDLRYVEKKAAELSMKDRLKREALERAKEAQLYDRVDSLMDQEANESDQDEGECSTYRESSAKKSLGLIFKGGNPIWIGGEVLVRDGKCVWLRRMRDYRGHVGTKDIRALLGAEA